MQAEGGQQIHMTLDPDGSKSNYLISAAADLGMGCPLLPLGEATPEVASLYQLGALEDPCAFLKQSCCPFFPH